jgi:hypothetical protein
MAAIRSPSRSSPTTEIRALFSSLLGAERIVLDSRLDLVEARALYLRRGYAEIQAYKNGPYAEIWYGKDLTSTLK